MVLMVCAKAATKASRVLAGIVCSGAMDLPQGSRRALYPHPFSLLALAINSASLLLCGYQQVCSDSQQRFADGSLRPCFQEHLRTG